MNRRENLWAHLLHLHLDSLQHLWIVIRVNDKDRDEDKDEHDDEEEDEEEDEDDDEDNDQDEL